MKNQSQSTFGDHPLLNRMILYVFLFTAVTTMALTGFKIFFSYRQEVTDIHHHLDNLDQSQLETLTNNVWDFNEETIAIQLNSMLQHPDIIYMTLTNTHGNQYAAGVKPVVTEKILLKQFDLNYLHQGVDNTIASGKIYATTNKITKRLLKQLPGVIGEQFIIVIFVCGFILLLFHFLFNRHLFQIASFTQTLNLDSLDHALVLSRRQSKGEKPDELDRIVFAINDMRERLQEGIRQKEEAEKSLRENEEKYRQIYNAPSEAIFIHDAQDGTILDVNQTMLDIYGYSRAEALELSIGELCSSDEHNTGKKAVQQILQTVTNGHALVKWQARRKDGELFWVEATLQHIKIGGKERVLAVVRDITERNRLESELRQAQKMEAIGTLAGGIAHDFNNILAAIFGFNELARMQAKDNQKLSSYLQEVHQAAKRARDLVKQILTFSRRAEQEKQPLQIALIVKEALKLIRSSIPTTINITTNIVSRATVLADPTQIHQIVMNLCTNAYHSMREQGGTLAVALTETDIEPGDRLCEVDLAPGKYLRLEISDTGIGMDSQTRKKIFEPYFTTKDAGEGTGLGLAVVHGIITSHNGQIHVYSEPGQGTTFNVYLPIVTEVSPASPVNGTKEITGGNERILFIDDEEKLTQMAEDFFTGYGYTITTFTDPIPALHHLKKQPDGYDLVITDMAMPSLTGVELAKQMLALRPDLPIILCTGYSETINKESSLKIGIRMYCQKPVMLGKLVESVRRILDNDKKR